MVCPSELHTLKCLACVQERVLLAERALLYCFGFDFRTEDPYSFALKYQTTYKLLDEDNSQRMLQWLSHAALFTTLCLQYPSSLLGVVAVWYAQHLVHGEVRPPDNIDQTWHMPRLVFTVTQLCIRRLRGADLVCQLAAFNGMSNLHQTSA